jgi:ankyrin repeat protein
MAGRRMRSAKKACLLLAFAVAMTASGCQSFDSAQYPWITLDAGQDFSLQAPTGTRYVQLQGTDSFVADFRNPRFTLEFDYGEYSNTLQGAENDPRYKVEYITIDGLKARLLTGPEPTDDSGCRHQTAVYVVNSYVALGMSSLEMNGCTDDEKQIPVIQRIFKSIKFMRPPMAAAGEELFAAAANGDLATVQALIVAGTDVNAKTDEGATPLIIAAKYGHADIVRALIAAQADVNARTCFQGYAAMVTAEGDDNVDTAAAHAKTCVGLTALLAASLENHVAVVKALIAAKADVNARTIGDHGHMALFWAAENGRADLARALIAGGADVHAVTRNGMTALMEASDNRYADVVRVLITGGADVNARKEDGETPLIIASYRDFKDVIRALIAAGANVNAKTKTGDTALKRALKEGHADVVQILKDAGGRE